MVLKFYVAIFIVFFYKYLTIPFIRIPKHYQWILALFLPLPKMLFIKLFLMICSKAYGSIKHSVKVCVVHNVHLQHALFLVLTMGFTATETTSYTILGLKFVMSLQNCLKIIYKLKYSKKRISMKEGRFQF